MKNNYSPTSPPTILLTLFKLPSENSTVGPTYTSILSLLDDLLHFLYNILPTRVMFLELYSSVDTYLNNYISNRTYINKIKKSLSPKCIVRFGVPQGSSPLLYIYYIYIYTYVSTYSLLRGYPTTSISGNNVRKCLLENHFLASCRGIPPLKLLYFRQVAGKYGVYQHFS